jgi:hypothetical protein
MRLSRWFWYSSCLFALTGCGDTIRSESTGSVHEAFTTSVVCSSGYGAVVNGTLTVGSRVSFGASATVVTGALSVNSNSSFAAPVYSDGNVSLGSDNVFHAPLEYGGTLSVGTGNQFLAGSTPGLTYSPGIDFREPTSGTTNISVPPGRTLTLAPGVYGNILVSSRATINFQDGPYNMASLTVQPSSNVNIASGSVDLEVVNNVQWDGAVTVGSGSVTLWVAGSTVNVSTPSFPIWIIAPAATVTIGAGTQVVGCIAANNLTFGDGSSTAGDPND